MGKDLYIIAGPNGAGRTTFAREFLPNYANCRNFINADLIAAGVSPFSPEAAAFRAGRLMLREIEEYSRRGESFGFETTLAGRSYLRIIRSLKKQGYAMHLYFLWLPSVGLALDRIRIRVRKGGHDVPQAIVLRRFDRSIRNFFARYQNLANSWILFDNSGERPMILARKRDSAVAVINRELYNSLIELYAKP
jgi:predicted ABC-type ATPase